VRHRLLVTLALCLLLLAVGLAAPAHGAPATVDAQVITLAGLAAGSPSAASAAAGSERDRMRASVESLAPLPFSMVGLDVPAGAQAEIRTSADGRDWTPWVAVEVNADERPDATTADGDAANGQRPGEGAATTTSAPVWVGEARHLQTRVAGADPEAVAVHLVDSVGLSRSLPERVAGALRTAWSGTPSPALAAPDQPLIRSREEWGADPARTGTPQLAGRVRNGFLHHTVTANGYAPGDVPAILRGIQAYHVDVQGWSDIGYNLLVDRYGTVWEGRAGGVDNPVIGAQAGGFNTGSFGVALLGDFSGSSVPAAAVDGLARLLAWKYDVHHVDVTSQVDVVSGGSTRYPEGVPVRLPTLAGHRDVSQTSCPGGVYNLLPSLRARVAAEQGAVLLDHSAAPDSVRVVNGASLDGPVTFSTRLRPPGDWSLEVRDPSGAVVHTAGGSGELATSTWSPAAAVRGTHTYAFSGPGRRPAGGAVDLRPPALSGLAVEPARVSALEDGGLSQPVSLHAGLWPGAAWSALISDAEGAEAFRATGTGEALDTSWDGAGATPGTYTWRIAADDVEPATGQITVVREALRRIATDDDPVANGVALSAAAFPETSSARTAVLARADVFADAMTGGPLAGAGGPVLLSGSDTLDDRVRLELERVLPPGETVYLLGGDTAMSPAVAEALSATWDVVRLGGAERIETAALVAGEVLGRSGASMALVARASSPDSAPWADALAGGAWGADRGYPVLLTESASLSPPAAEAIARLGITETVVLGGTAAISQAVADALPAPRRVAGEERAATAAAVASELWGAGAGAGGRVLVTGGYAEDAWTLALTATPLAALQDAPLYVAGDTLPGATAAALEARGPGVTGLVLGAERQVGAAAAGDANAALD